MDEGLILLLVGAILLASIVVALFASRTGVPTLVSFLAPRGTTLIEADDHLFVLVPRKRRPHLEDVFARWRRRV